MSKIKWDSTGERLFEVGVTNGVLYVQENGTYPKGVAWNGLTAVTESPSGAEATDLYADDIKYATLRSAETFGATVEAYMYPEEFCECDGSAEAVRGVYVGQQTRKAFGLCYRTSIGSDTNPDMSAGFKLHLIYNATASPSEKAYQTINDSPDAITFSWELATTPVAVTGYKAAATITIDSTKVDSDKLDTLMAELYGTDGESGKTAHLPTPDEVIAMLQ